MVIPLDERPCNYNYVQYLARDTHTSLLLPPKTILGDKKIKANLQMLDQWIFDNLNDVSAIILSVDMIVYGGIVPSRLHSDDVETLKTRLNIIKDIKKHNKFLKIYSYNLLMRNPTYSSSDEEPDYYELYGKEIHLQGVYTHKQNLGIITASEEEELLLIKNKLPRDIYEDYTGRRHKNLVINKAVIDLLAQDVLDYLVIPQDDASAYGLTVMDREHLKAYIDEVKIRNNLIMYPDADAVVDALFSRALLEENNVKPNIYVQFANNDAKVLIPKYEDIPLGDSIPLQIQASGSMMTNDIHSADIILMVNASPAMMDIYSEEYKVISQNSKRLNDLEIFVKKIKEYIESGQKVMIADIATANGSDNLLMKKLIEYDLLFSLAGYAGWNTSGNTLGSVIASGVMFFLYGNTQSHLDFLGLRYVEDYLYMSKIRKEVTEKYLPDLNYNYFNAGEQRGKVAQIVEQLLHEKLRDLSSKYEIHITDCYMPWKRMFEVGVDVIVKQKESE